MRRGVFLYAAVSHFPPPLCGFLVMGFTAPELLEILDKPPKIWRTQRRRVQILALRRVPCRLMAFRGASSRLKRFRVFYLPHLGAGDGGARRQNYLGIWANQPKYGGDHGWLAKFHRSVAFRSVPWSPAVRLFALGGLEIPISFRRAMVRGCPTPNRAYTVKIIAVGPPTNLIGQLIGHFP